MGNILDFAQLQRRKILFVLLGASIAFYLLTSSYTTPRDLTPTKTQIEAQAASFITSSSATSKISPVTTPSPSPRAKSPFCVAFFLGADYHGENSDADDADWYFMGARTLVYQLLHAPDTKFTDPIELETEPIPMIVLVTKDVRESKRKRLEADGAKVVVIEEVKSTFAIKEPRYAQVLTKLRLFDPEILPYEKVFLMDTDMVITRPIDAIFQDDAAQLRPVDYNRTSTGPDTEIGRLPQKFMFAAEPENPSRDKNHPYPFLDPERTQHYFNVGCMLFSPSKEIYEFYLATLEHPDLFGHGWPEQDLLNYIHRLDGPMPWGRLHYSWYLSWPNENDVKGNMAILHAKFWSDREHEVPRRVAIGRVSEMKGYWIGKES